MARPIAPTPRLDEASTEKFLSKIEHDLNEPIGSVPTPKAENAIKMIMEDAISRQK